MFFLLLDNILVASIEMTKDAHSMGEAIRIEILGEAAERFAATGPERLGRDGWWRKPLAGSS